MLEPFSIYNIIYFWAIVFLSHQWLRINEKSNTFSLSFFYFYFYFMFLAIVFPSHQWKNCHPITSIDKISLSSLCGYLHQWKKYLSFSFFSVSFFFFFWLLSSLRINRKNYLSSRQWKKSLSLSLCLPKEDCLPFTSMEKFSLHFYLFIFFKLVSSLHINKKNISFFLFLLFLAIVFPSQ